MADKKEEDCPFIRENRGQVDEVNGHTRVGCGP